MSKKSQEVSALAPENTGKILWFQTEDGQTQLDVRLENETVWLSVQQIAYLFGRDDKTIRKHINNAIREELSFFRGCRKICDNLSSWSYRRKSSITLGELLQFRCDNFRWISSKIKKRC